VGIDSFDVQPHGTHCIKVVHVGGPGRLPANLPPPLLPLLPGLFKAIGALPPLLEILYEIAAFWILYAFIVASHWLLVDCNFLLPI
jgi:hypothetical protein